MPLNKENSSRINYNANLNWYKEKIYSVTNKEKTLEEYLLETKVDFEGQKHTAEEYIGILESLSLKAGKLEGKIAYLSKDLKIKVDAAKQPELAKAVAALDSVSKGEYIDYALYDKLLRQQEYAYNSVSINHLVNNTTGDPLSDSSSIRNQILEGYASYPGQEKPQDNSLQRYTNRWLNNLVSWNEHDYQSSQILNFADNYLSIFPDPAYIPWSMRRDVGEERVDAKSLGDVWKYFSADYSSRVQDMVDGINGMASLKMDPKVDGLTARYIKYANEFLNQLNKAFDTDWSVNMICCFLQWGVKIDLKTLKGLRAMLQLLKTGIMFDFEDVLNGIKDIVNNIFRGLLCDQLVSLVTYITQSLVDPIRLWLDNIEKQSPFWQKVTACTPVDDLINKYIAEAMEYLSQLLTTLIHNWYKKIEIKNIKNTYKLEITNNLKMIGDIAELLDWIIYAVEAAAKCGVGNSPDGEVPATILADYKLDSAEPYVFPEEASPTIWNSFIPEQPIVTDSTNRTETSAITSEYQTTSADGVRTSNFDTGSMGAKVSEKKKTASIDECLKNIPVGNIEGVKAWIEEIRQKSMEKAK